MPHIGFTGSYTETTDPTLHLERLGVDPPATRKVGKVHDGELSTSE